jgi:hypothetical protein
MTEKRFGGALQCGEPIFIIDMSHKHGKDAYKVYPYSLEAAQAYADCMHKIMYDENYDIESKLSGAV